MVLWTVGAGQGGKRATDSTLGKIRLENQAQHCVKSSSSSRNAGPDLSGIVRVEKNEFWNWSSMMFFEGKLGR